MPFGTACCAIELMGTRRSAAPSWTFRRRSTARRSNKGHENRRESSRRASEARRRFSFPPAPRLGASAAVLGPRTMDPIETVTTQFADQVLGVLEHAGQKYV